MTLDGPSDTEQVSVRRGFLTAAGLALAVAVTNGLARFAYALILPAMRSDLGWNYTEAGWNNTANAIGYLVGAVIVFRAVRHVSPRRLFAANLWVTTAALTLTGLTADFMLLAVLRFVAGAAGAVAFVAGSVLAANIFARDTVRSATAIAVYFAGGGAAILLSGLTMPWLFAYAGDASWPYAWIGMGVASAAMTFVAIGAARYVREPEIRVGAHSWIKRPFIPLLLAYGIFGVGYIAYMTFIIAWLREHGAQAGEIALFWAVLGLATILAPPVWRRALAEWPGGRPLAAVLVVMAVGGALPRLFLRGAYSDHRFFAQSTTAVSMG
jgi:MFS family permease